MQANIISLNIGQPEEMFWDGKSVVSSMHRKPISGGLIVHKDHIDGDGFKNASVHGTIDSVIYLMGQDALEEYAKLLGKNVSAGEAGENVTLDALDERAVAVGDEFRVGEVVFQATFPRIPCGKVNFRFQHAQAQNLMMALGRSGVYGKIIAPGKIKHTDKLVRTKMATNRISIAKVYDTWIRKDFPNPELFQSLKDNSAFPVGALQRLRS